MARFVPICQSADTVLSILIASDNSSHLKKISEGIKQLDDQKEGFLKVYTCESVSQILSVTEPPEVDFVVFFVNLKRLNALAEIEASILKLDKKFLLDRICLICDSSQPKGSIMPKIIQLKHKYQLHVLWADLEASFLNLSKRLINLSSAVCGATSGFPIITHRSWHH